MRAITLTQPWATLCALGVKRIETRSWVTSYRGPLAIHAAKGLGPVGGMKGLMNQCARKHFLPALDIVMPEHLRGIGSPASIAERLPRGAIVAVCELYMVISTDGLSILKTYAEMLPNGSACVWRLTDQERAFGDYTSGRFAWLLANIRALPEPVPAKGALGLWEPDTLTQMAVQRQLIASVEAT